MVLTRWLLVTLLTASSTASSIGCRKPRESKDLSDQQLAALPYLAGATGKGTGSQTEGSGVIKTDARALAHLTAFVPSLNKTSAVVIDMAGRVQHEWQSNESAPTYDPIDRELGLSLGWGPVSPEPNGDLYVGLDYRALLKLDRSSKVLWKADVAVNHDIDVDGDVVRVLADAIRYVDVRGVTVPIIDQEVVTLSAADGSRKSAFSIYALLDKSPKTHDLIAKETGLYRKREYTPDRADPRVEPSGPDLSLAELVASDAEIRVDLLRKFRPEEASSLEAFRKRFVELADQVATRSTKDVGPRHFAALSHTRADMLHTNTLETVGVAVPGLWERGDLLISMRSLDLIMVVDRTGETIKWAWGPGELSHQHAPTVIANGNVLVFDNGAERKQSRLVEVDPRTGKIVWVHDTGFFASGFGGVERLANGDTFFNDPFGARLLEVTPQHEVVWEYHSPSFDPVTHKRTPIYRAYTLPLDHLGSDSK